ncbi:Hypothetical protein LLA12_02410 [Lactococcus lactis subsp. lactis]|nr:Hypothetical protein LLA12_02410 [Lactococcus lactis subsp. lactis]
MDIETVILESKS